MGHIIYNPVVASICYAVVGSILLVALWAFGVAAIQDPGGYQDSYFPAKDKLQHAGCSLTLVLASAVVGVPLTGAWAITIGFGALWETMQRFPAVPYHGVTRGYFSVPDLVYDVLGSSLGWGIAWACLR